MIATVALEQFKTLYTIGSDAGDGEELGNAEAMVGTYAAFKEAIFARYRTVAEILGVLLVKQCQTSRLNVMVETSGRDVGMFQYVDTLFPGGEGERLPQTRHQLLHQRHQLRRAPVDTRMRMR